MGRSSYTKHKFFFVRPQNLYNFPSTAKMLRSYFIILLLVHVCSFFWVKCLCLHICIRGMLGWIFCSVLSHQSLDTDHNLKKKKKNIQPAGFSKIQCKKKKRNFTLLKLQKKFTQYLSGAILFLQIYSYIHIFCCIPPQAFSWHGTSFSVKQL